MNTPLVSILMVARNAAPFIEAAILSAREQTFSDLEVIVVDDGSSDDTAAIASLQAAQDPRVRVIAGPRKGLSAVRNASLAAARGRFALVLDSDDLLHPAHVQGLVDARADHGAHVLATNMVEFRQDGGVLHTRPFAQGALWRGARTVGVEEYLHLGRIGGEGPSLGYLKPLFDLDFLRAQGLGYDEGLRIGEDFDLVSRLLLAGARLRYLPQATYYYRKHDASTSHRLARSDVEGLLAAAQRYEGRVPGERAAIAARCANLEATLLHLDAIAAIKGRRIFAALRIVAANAQARALTFAAVTEATSKRISRPRTEPQGATYTGLPSSLADHLLAATRAELAN